MKIIFAGVFTIMLLTAPVLRGQGKEARTTIILVRHAEKDTMKTDPPLTATGRARARLLARILGLSGAHSTHSTQYRRTVETVAPLDSALGIANEVIPANPDSLEAYASALVGHLLTIHKGETTVVSSHSNVLPMLIRAFGVTTPVMIDDRDYDNLFVITVDGRAEPAFAHLQMGLE